MSLFMRVQCVCATFLSVAIVACNQQQQSPDQLREKAAQETATLKRDTKAVAEGIRQGWNRDRLLNLNTATKDQLQSVGLSAREADNVITRRPFHASNELVTKRILSGPQYDKIKDRVTAN